MKPFVAILMGSESDLPVMRATSEVLEKFGISYEVKVASAHRTPHYTQKYIQEVEQRGCCLFIAAAGLAAHLAGTVAAHTIKPVIGVPMDAGSLNGLDSLLSTVQMPGGIPVACVAIGKAGAKNAAYLAVQILAIQDQELARKLDQDRRDSAAAIIAKNEEFSQQIS